MTDTTATPDHDTPASPLAVAPDLGGTTVAVTGANGFVGSRTCALLAAAGADVRALVRRAGTAPESERITEVVSDIDGSADLPGDLDGVDVVVHTAATAGADLDVARAVNVEGTRHVLAAARAAGVRRVVHVSTAAVYAPNEDGGPIDEDAPLVGEDSSPYAVTKREAEEVVAEEADDEVETVVLRPPAILGWGPSSTWGQRVPAWIGDDELPDAFEGKGERDPFSWVHVDDFAAAIALAVDADDAAGRTYVVVTGNIDWGTYAGRVHTWFPDAPTPFVASDEPPTPRRLDAGRIADELGWMPTVDLDTAMDEIAARHT